MGSLQQYANLVTSVVHNVQAKLGLSGTKTKGSITNSTAIELNDHGFAVAEVIRYGDSFKITNSQFVHNTNQNIRSELISEMFQRRSISAHHVTMVLSGNSYKFLLAEAPEAPLESLRFVMPNKIKDSLPWKVSEVTADVLPLPPDAFRGRKNSVYVAVAQKKYLEDQLNLLNGVNIYPEAITTMEMAIKAYWHIIKPEKNTSIGILRMNETGGVIVMMCDGAVYLARRIIVDLASLSDEGTNRQDVFDQVVLEIQRSVDFYESQLGKGAVAQIIMLPPPMDLGIGFEYIEQNISTDISVLNPFEELNYDQELSIKDQAYCTGAIGAAIEGLKNV